VNFSHHNLQVELNDDWWAEAGMVGFVPQSKAYRTPSIYKNQLVYEVSVEDVGPLTRASIFKDDMAEEHQTARERVVRLLRGFRFGDSIPPVEVVDSSPGYGYPYKLTHGAHRLYWSLAAGFTHVPAVNGFDWSALVSRD
jgi:hypothetical protein